MEKRITDICNNQQVMIKDLFLHYLPSVSCTQFTVTHFDQTHFHQI